MSATPLPKFPAGKRGGGSSGARKSYALEQVTEYLGSFECGQVVDLGGACQSNIDYATGMGHRLYAEDVLLTLAGWQGEPPGAASAAEREAESLPPGCLEFPRASVHAALCWDRLQFLSEGAASSLVARLHHILVPGGVVLALFNPDPGARPPLACRVAGGNQLQLDPSGAARPYRGHSTRSIEKLFHAFESLKFYLTRENLQEVIVRR
jgi:hypothetical protein